MATRPNWPQLAQGQNSKNVKALQHLLVYRGYGISTDGIFGGDTRNAVVKFQSSRGLSADGVAGANTLSALIATVGNGSNGQAAYAAQTLLSKFETLGVDGMFYGGSATAARTFQQKMGISADGIVGPTTWQYLFGYNNYPAGTGGGDTGGGDTSGVYASICAGVSTLSTAQMTANARYICRYLMNQGFTKNAACAVLGNMEAEGGINPGIWERRDNTSYGYGLVQWTPATKFINRAVNRGIITSATASAVNNLATSAPKALMDAELECLIWGCTSGGEFFAPASSMQHSEYRMTFAQFKASTLSAGTLAVVFHDHFERSADGTTGLNNRSNKATNWYNTI